MTGVDRATSRSRAWAFRLAALGLATVLAIAVAEVAVRVVDPFGVHYHSHIEGLRRLARWSARTPLIYENAPSTKTVIHGVEYRINSLGHRGPEPRLAVPAVRRILGVGDSVTFGAGVNQDETFLELVARRLSRPSQPWDAYNTGVVSYGIHQELEVLGIWLPRIEPAVVVHCFVANDIQRALPPLNQRFPGWQRFHGRRSPVDVWTSVDSWIAAPLLRRVTPALSDLMVHAITSRAEEANRRTLAAGGLDSETLLMESAAWRESARALKDYCQLARQHARSVVFVAMVAASGKLSAALDRIVPGTGVHLVVPARDPRWSRVAPEALRVSVADPHPSVLGHRLLAEMIAEVIEKDLGR